MKFGIIPPMQKGFTTNPAWARPFLKMIEGAGVESVWTVEHPIVAENYEPLYPYAEDGRPPIASKCSGVIRLAVDHRRLMGRLAGFNDRRIVG